MGNWRSRPAKPTIPLELTSACPFRPMDWRWQHATFVHRHRLRLNPHRDDPWVRNAVRSLRANDPKRASARTGRTTELASIAQARALLGSNDPWPRRELEARLLTGEPFEVIAERCRLPELTVVAYEALFFDVRVRLPHADHITFMVLKSDPDSTSDDDLGLCLRRYAYEGGPRVLDRLLELIDPRVSLTKIGEVSAKQVVEDRIVRISIALRSVQLTEKTLPLWFRLAPFLETVMSMASRPYANVNRPVDRAVLKGIVDDVDAERARGATNGVAKDVLASEAVWQAVKNAISLPALPYSAPRSPMEEQRPSEDEESAPSVSRADPVEVEVPQTCGGATRIPEPESDQRRRDRGTRRFVAQEARLYDRDDECDNRSGRSCDGVGEEAAEPEPVLLPIGSKGLARAENLSRTRPLRRARSANG